jgi:hypothetical protein
MNLRRTIQRHLRNKASARQTPTRPSGAGLNPTDLSTGREFVGHAIFNEVAGADSTVLSVPKPTIVTDRNDDHGAVRSLAEVSILVIPLGTASETGEWHSVFPLEVQTTRITQAPAERSHAASAHQAR